MSRTEDWWELLYAIMKKDQQSTHNLNRKMEETFTELLRVTVETDVNIFFKWTN